MKKNILTQSLLLLAALLVSSTVHAQITLTFNENGGTSASSGTDPFTDLGVQEDSLVHAGAPGTPTDISTLDYGALFSSTANSAAFDGGNSEYPVAGWLAIYAPGGDYGTTTGLLDLILFDNTIPFNSKTYVSMFWYSDEGSGNLADTLSQFSANELNTILSPSDTTLQYITENNLGLATYTPTNSADGGYINGTGSSVKQYTYDFQSATSPLPRAPVPEPATVFAGALLLVPMGISLIRILSRKRAIERQN